MLINYKTILHGDKPIEYFKEKRLEPNSIFKYEVIEYKFCCDEMEDYLIHGFEISFSDDLWAEPNLVVSIPDGYGDSDNKAIHFCQFCGKPIESKEIKRVRLKGIKKELIEYIEEDMK